MPSLKTFDVKNDQISENYKKTSTFLYKTVYYTVQSQYLTLKFKNFISGFFPDFPDPVFSRKKTVCGLVQGQAVGHFITCVYIVQILYKAICWRLSEYMKIAKN